MSSAALAELVELTRALDKASAPLTAEAGQPAPAADAVSDSHRALDVLDSFLRLESVSADDLRATKAGLLVGRLGKAANADIAKKAKEVIARWKSQVLPGGAVASTAIEQAKANAAAAAAAKAKAASVAAAKAKAAAAAAAAAAESKEDSDSDDGAKKSKSAKRKEKEGADKNAKKRKTDRSPSPAAARKREASLTEQNPELAKGPFGLFKTDDSLRDRMQLMLWTAIGEPPASVLAAQAAAQAQAASVDLSAYKVTAVVAADQKLGEEDGEEEKKKPAEPTEPVPTASPSPPPVAELQVSSPAVTPALTSEGAPVFHAAGVEPAAAVPAAAAVPSPAAPQPPIASVHSRLELAFRIESAMFAKFKNADSYAYKQKYRDLAPQLRDSKNDELNENLFFGRITVSDLITLPVAALAPSALKAKRDAEAKYNTEERRCDIGMDAGATDIFQCDVCKERHCTYFQMQTRGADEPMTIFVTCLMCGNKFRSGDGER